MRHGGGGQGTCNLDRGTLERATTAIYINVTFEENSTIQVVAVVAVVASSAARPHRTPTHTHTHTHTLANGCRSESRSCRHEYGFI